MNVSLEKLELEIEYIIEKYMFEVISIPKLNKLKYEITELLRYYNYEPDKYIFISATDGNINIISTDKDYEPEISYTNNRFEDVQRILNRYLNLINN